MAAFVRSGGARWKSRVVAEGLERRLALAAGDLDPTFGGDGIVLSDFPTPVPAGVRAVLVQPDGKYVAAGGAVPSGFGKGDFALARFHPDGTVDASFGAGGTTFVDFGDVTAQALELALAPGGKIVVAGSVARGESTSVDYMHDFAVARLHPDGTLDAGFGAGGKVVVGGFEASVGGGRTGNRPSGGVPSSVLVRADGRVVLAGSTVVHFQYIAPEPIPYYGFTAVQLTSDGRLDPAFDGDGKASVRFSESTSARAAEAVLDAGGRVVVAGRLNTPWSSTAVPLQMVLAAIAPDGQLDPSFGTGGWVAAFPGSGAGALTIDPAGRLVAAGSGPSATGSNADFAVARFSADGVLDASFGNGGTVTADFGATGDVAHAVGVDADGRIILGGVSSNLFTVVRLTPDGAADTSFADGGRSLFGPGIVHDLALDPAAGAGSVVLAGSARYSPGLVRLTPAGAPDPSFGGDGHAAPDYGMLPSGSDSANAVVVQPDGHVVVGGPGMLARYAPDGTLVRRTTHPADRPDRWINIYDLALQRDGKVVGSGYGLASGDPANPNDLVVVRYNADGSADESFGDAGVARVRGFEGRSSPVYARPVAVQRDGKIVVAAGGGVARLLPSGRPDPSFGGGDGVVSIGPTGGSSEIRVLSIALQPDGKVVLGCGGFVDPRGVVRVARLHRDGSLDTSFGGDGFAELTVGSSSTPVLGLFVGADGAITAGADGPDSTVVLARFGPDGTPDPVVGGGPIDTYRSGYNNSINAIRFAPDGTAYVAATYEFEGPNHTTATDALIAAFGPDGRPAQAFGRGGIVRTDWSGVGDRANDLAVAPDGKVVVAGSSGTRQGDVAVARYEGVPAAAARVVGRFVFHNGSAYDGGDAGATADDDFAIDATRRALLPGRRAAPENVTSYSRGINGVMIDVAGLPSGAAVAAEDFSLRRSGGPAAAPPTSITVRRGEGLNGSDRVTLAWAGGATANGWLEVTVRPTARTGLARADVFAFGSLVGETSPAGGAFRVDAVDIATMRAAVGAAARASELVGGEMPDQYRRFDHTGDGRVDGSDLAVVRANWGRTIATIVGGTVDGRGTPARRMAWESGAAATLLAAL